MRTRRRATSRCDRADKSVSPCGSNFEMVKPLTLTLRTRKQNLPTNALVESEAFCPQSVPLQGALSVIEEVGGSTPLLWVCFQTTLSKQAKKHGLPDWPGLSLGSFRSWGLGPFRSGCPVLIVLAGQLRFMAPFGSGEPLEPLRWRHLPKVLLCARSTTGRVLFLRDDTLKKTLSTPIQFIF